MITLIQNISQKKLQITYESFFLTLNFLYFNFIYFTLSNQLTILILLIIFQCQLLKSQKILPPIQKITSFHNLLHEVHYLQQQLKPFDTKKQNQYKPFLNSSHINHPNSSLINYPMQQSSSLSTKSYNTTTVNIYESQKQNNSSVNWISVINFLENQYTKSSLRQKEWFLQKKILNEQIFKLKSQLDAVENLNNNLNNRIKLLEFAIKKEKLLKSSKYGHQQNGIIATNVQKTRTIEAVQKYFQKNGWNFSQNKLTNQQNPHNKFLSKVLDQIGIKFNKIEQKCRKLSLNSVQTQQLSQKQKSLNFSTIINQLNKTKISQKIKINAHLDSIRGVYATFDKKNQYVLATVSQDCLLKVWNVNSKNKQKQNITIQPALCLRSHTGQLFTIDGGTSNTVSEDLILFTAGSQQLIKVWYAPSVDKLSNLKLVGSFLNDQKHQNSQQFDEYNEIVWSLKYKQKKLLTSASDGVVRLFKTDIQSIDNKVISSVKIVNEYSQKNYLQTAIQWVGQSGFLAGCSNSPRIYLWDIQTKKIMQRFIYQIDKPKQQKSNIKKDLNINYLYQINSLKYQSDNKLIYSGCQDKLIRIFSYDQNKMIKKIETQTNNSINCIDIYKNNFIVAGCQNGDIKVWDRRTYKLLIDEPSHLQKYDEGILCLRTTQQAIFTGGADGIVNLYSF